MGFAFDIQVIARQPFAHLGHIVLQRGAADEPLIRQILQLERPGGGQKARQHIAHPLGGSARHAQRRAFLQLQPLETLRILDF